jgi:hypothetical protein
MSKEVISVGCDVSRGAFIKAALRALNQTGDVREKSLFYHAIVAGELYLAVARTEQHDGSDVAVSVDVMAVTGPDGAPAVVAYAELPDEAERIPGMHYLLKSGLEVLQLVVDGGFGGLIVDPQGPWAGVPRQDAANLLLNLTPA